MAAIAVALSAAPAGAAPQIERVEPDRAGTGVVVRVYGREFGPAPGRVVLAGLRIAATGWSDTEIEFAVPGDAATGSLAVRSAAGLLADGVPFTVERSLPPGQIAPHGLAVEQTGLLGSAFLVETDGAGLYALSGFETLTTCEMLPSQPHAVRGRFHFNQRVGDLRLHGGYLFCAGDHGLSVYRCADLQAGRSNAVAAVAGASCLGLDVKPDPAGEFPGGVVALCEHRPRWGTNLLRVVFYAFEEGELSRLGTYTRSVGDEERQHSIALDPLRRKTYVSGWEALDGNTNKYILELRTDDLDAPVLGHRENTGGTLAMDMDARGDVLWCGVVETGTEWFRRYRLHDGATPLALDHRVLGRWAPGKASRVRVLDDRATVGCAWFGQRPDLFLMNTLGSNAAAEAVFSTIDWAFDVAGFARGDGSGRVVVADEWGGFLTLDYATRPAYAWTHAANYQWVPAAAMTEGLHLAEDRVYVAGRGAGVWSAAAARLDDASQWRSVDWQWGQSQPQPYPISAVCTRRDPEAGLLIAALGHEKAMAWGTLVTGQLYRETPSNIVLLAQSQSFDPPGLGSTGVSAVWPESDLVYMAAGSDGFRAYVVDPAAPSIALHRDCRQSGFATNLYRTAHLARCLRHVRDGDIRRLIVGGELGLLVADPSLNVFRLDYPLGVPDRNAPDRPIFVTHEAGVRCLRFKTVYNLDVRPSGWVAAATSTGLAVFHLSWIPALNAMFDFQSWALIAVPTSAFAPWWRTEWTAQVADAAFADDQTLYVVKNTEGVWRLHLELDAARLTQRAFATACYPGVECGMDYRTMLHGWGNPDILTLHHPYGVAANPEAAFVTGWNGKVQRLRYDPSSGARIEAIAAGRAAVDLSFTAPFGSRTYELQRADGPAAAWNTDASATIQPAGDERYTVRCATGGAGRACYRIRVRP